MDRLSVTLRFLFTNYIYPAIIISLFIWIILLIVIVVMRAKTVAGIIRRLAGAAVPFVFLIFTVVASQDKHDVISDLVASIGPILAFLGGAAVGVLLLEIGRLLRKTDTEIGPSLYAFFLSSVASFILYSIMIGILKSLHLPMFGVILAAALDVMFRGPFALE